MRRHLLVGSPGGTKALLRTTDPMEDLLRRYAFLVESAGTHIIVLVDNLDRCHADYVVEMLEGIQTLFRTLPSSRARFWRSSPRRKPLVAFVVAADKGWLCDSYLHAYQEFGTSAREPGRPFGLAFVDKIFELALRIPTVPAAAAVEARTDPDRKAPRNPFQDCEQELQVRQTLLRAETTLQAGRRTSEAPVPVLALRTYAVEKLAEIETRARRRRDRIDTTIQLDELLARVDPGPIIRRQLETAYCVNRTAQLLGGHAVDADDRAIYRLGLWTLLELKWPLLASELARHPHCLERHAGDATLNEDLESIFEDPLARRLTDQFREVKLTAKIIEQLTQPLSRPSLAAAQGARERVWRAVIDDGRPNVRHARSRSSI
jgi:KAP family P-loop domain